MALGSTQSLIEISTRDLPLAEGVGGAVVKTANNLATFMCRLSENPGSLIYMLLLSEGQTEEAWECSRKQ